MRFHTTIERTGPNTAGIPVPDEVLTALGGGRRPAVTASLNGYIYRSTVGLGGRSLIPLSSAHRAPAGVEGVAALAAEPAALATFERRSAPVTRATPCRRAPS